MNVVSWSHPHNTAVLDAEKQHRAIPLFTHFDQLAKKSEPPSGNRIGKGAAPVLQQQGDTLHLHEAVRVTRGGVAQSEIDATVFQPVAHFGLDRAIVLQRTDQLALNRLPYQPVGTPGVDANAVPGGSLYHLP